MSGTAGAYDFAAIEAKWQRYWEEHKTFRTVNPGEAGFDPSKEKFYVLDMFPYPSGVGLHVGHPLGYIATDVFARFKRMRGFNVLHPMGYDAFGLPAEQYAVEHGEHPRGVTERNIANIRAQFRRLGLGYDWDRELATTDVGYYRWTQWIFLQLYNSWYDRAAGRARPIAELIHQLENEHYHVSFDGRVVHAGAMMGLEAIAGGPPGARVWSELAPDEQREVIDTHRLAFLDEVPVNWCPALGTVLANEEVTNEGRSERGNHPVFRRPLTQWMLRITEYADRLGGDLDLVDWPESVKLMQRNWIGRSEGAEVEFRVEGSGGEAPASEEGTDSDLAITVYTTRPDTLFGATYMVLAPEHELVGQITTDGQREAVGAYVDTARNKSDLERTTETKTKTGVFTGAYAINPVNNERIPIWVADYVLMGYGTGAIMAVPGHDTRDLEFAQTFGLPVVQVVQPPAGVDWAGFVDDGISVNSPPRGEGVDTSKLSADVCDINGLPTPEAKRQITEWLEAKELGRGAVNYKLRDWLFSRQRYWGEPFPIVHDVETEEVFALDASELPVKLPEIDDFTPAASDDPNAPPRPPLGRATDWLNVMGYVLPNGSVKLLLPGQRPPDDVTVRRFRREMNTMPQWAGSCWYYLRYIDNKNDKAMVTPEFEQYWMAPRAAAAGQTVARGKGREEGDAGAAGIKPGPDLAGGVDLYVGGVEHAVLHLLYARFWHKVLFDLGIVSSPEPFGRLFNQGYIQAYAYQDSRGMYVDVKDVEERSTGGAVAVHHKQTGEPLTRSLGKMGKSLKNAVAPDEIIAEHGADTLRVYELYLGPLEASKPWSTRDIVGMSRFLASTWRKFVAQDGSLHVTDAEPEPSLLRLVHKTIKKVGTLMNELRFNTAIAALIELNNASKGDSLPRKVAEPFVRMLAPLAPHMAEELWQRLHGDAWRGSVAMESWPSYDPALAKDEEIEVPVQVKGRLRSRVMLPADAGEEQMRAAALADEKIQAELAGKEIVKVICVPGRLVNIVVK